MKIYTVPLFLLFTSFFSFAQSKEDYVKTLDFISDAFNKKEASLVHQKFSPDLKVQLSENVLKKTLDSLHIQQGVISTYELISDGDKEKSFLVEFENSSMLMVLFLSPENEISKFKIKEY